MPITVNIPERELFDDATQTFSYTKPVTVILEHSLISISKWEEKWKIPFLPGPNPKSKEKTEEMWDSYFACMAIRPKEIEPESFKALYPKERQRIHNYINEQRTASYVSEEPNKGGPQEQVTSELIYFWLINYNIPESYEKWHLSRLLMLVRICQRKTSTPEKNPNKNGQRSIENARLSAARRKAAMAKRKK